MQDIMIRIQTGDFEAWKQQHYLHATAMGWFRSDTFKEATKLAQVTGRRFYLAHPQT